MATCLKLLFPQFIKWSLVYKMSGNVENGSDPCFTQCPRPSLMSQTSESLINQLQSDDQTGWNRTSRLIYQDENEGEQ